MEPLSRSESKRIYSESDSVFYHPKVGFFVVEWNDEGNQDVPTVCPIFPIIDHRTAKLPKTIPLGFSKVAITEEMVTQAEYDLCNNSIPTKFTDTVTSRNVISAILSWFKTN